MNLKKINTKIALIAITFLAVLSGCSSFTNQNNQWKIFSPNSEIKVDLTLDSLERPVYSVYLNETLVISPSILGIDLEDKTQQFTRNLSFVESKESVVNDNYTMISGKKSQNSYSANKSIFSLENGSGNSIDIIFQVSNNGVAFRYQLFNANEAKVKTETSEFNLSGESLSWIQDFEKVGYSYAYEMFYPERKLDTLKHKKYLLPGLFHTPDKNWVFICDASIDENYAACELNYKGDGKLAVQLPNHTFEYKEWMKNTWQELLYKDASVITAPANLLTPWRAIILSNELGDIVESNLIEDLSTPSIIKDQSWIDPGVGVFPWWGYTLANDDPELLKKYIDAAAEMNWKYLEFDIGLLGNNGGHAANFWREIDYVPEVINYAKEKGIKVIGWDERKSLDTREKRDDIFSIYKKWGVAGIKMDFINSDKQEAMKWYKEATAHAAEYELMVSFHGSITPRGLRRTLPNIMTYEGVRGGEFYKFEADNRIPNPTHNCTLPFTRNITGPMDYTPTCFSTNRRKSTYAHELATAFVYESGWVNMADKPEAFLNSKAKGLLQNLSAAWDDIHFIEGYPGEYCCLARRKGNDWFIAAINSNKDRQIEINFDFLSGKNYEAKIYTDDKKDGLFIKEMTISAKTTEKFDLYRNGGFVIQITEETN